MSKKILVVDDDQDLLTFMTTLLEDNGYSTITALNGKECYEKAIKDNPDLITLDMTMPEQSGVRTYRDLKDHENLKKIPVIVVTAIGENMETFLSKRRQIPRPEGFMTKPVDQEKLIELIRNLVS